MTRMAEAARAGARCATRTPATESGTPSGCSDGGVSRPGPWLTNAMRRHPAWLLVCLCICGASAASPAHGDWTTYHGDAGRSGTDPTSGAGLPFAVGWTSPDLGGDIYGQPLIYGGHVIVGTEHDEIVALNASDG